MFCHDCGRELTTLSFFPTVFMDSAHHRKEGGDDKSVLQNCCKREANTPGVTYKSADKIRRMKFPARWFSSGTPLRHRQARVSMLNCIRKI
jgi:hypothetical protein